MTVVVGKMGPLVCYWWLNLFSLFAKITRLEDNLWKNSIKHRGYYHPLSSSLLPFIHFFFWAQFFDIFFRGMGWKNIFCRIVRSFSSFFFFSSRLRHLLAGRQGPGSCLQQSSRQGGRQAGHQAGHQAGLQAGRQAGRQAGHQAGLQAGHPAGLQGHKVPKPPWQDFHQRKAKLRSNCTSGRKPVKHKMLLACLLLLALLARTEGEFPSGVYSTSGLALSFVFVYWQSSDQVCLAGQACMEDVDCGEAEPCCSGYNVLNIEYLNI